MEARQPPINDKCGGHRGRVARVGADRVLYRQGKWWGKVTRKMVPTMTEVAWITSECFVGPFTAQHDANVVFGVAGQNEGGNCGRIGHWRTHVVGEFVQGVSASWPVWR